MTSNTNGSGTEDIQVQISELQPYLAFLDLYIQPRDKLHNMNQE